MLVVQPPNDTGAVVLVSPPDGPDPNAPDPPHDPAQAALQSNSSTTADLHSTVHDRAVPVPTRLGLDSSPALFLWESRTTNVDVMCVSNTTRPVAVSR